MLWTVARKTVTIIIKLIERISLAFYKVFVSLNATPKSIHTHKGLFGQMQLCSLRSWLLAKCGISLFYVYAVADAQRSANDWHNILARKNNSVNDLSAILKERRFGWENGKLNLRIQTWG